jgi:hypothetical protein
MSIAWVVVVSGPIRENSANPTVMIAVPATGKTLYRPVRLMI